MAIKNIKAKLKNLVVCVFTMTIAVIMSLSFVTESSADTTVTFERDFGYFCYHTHNTCIVVTAPSLE
jgi:hypothetical protein